jgi:hypothetical protein
MSTFSLLWGSIIHSSLWIRGTKDARLLFISMMAMRDSEGVIRSSFIGLADAAKIKPEECKVALSELMSPDPDDSSGVEDGRRVREVSGGWQIINHEHYQFSTESKREAWRMRKAKQRAIQIMSPEQRAEYELMTPAEKATFEIGVVQEYTERRRVGLRQAKKKGQIAGAKQAIKDGFADANSQT